MSRWRTDEGHELYAPEIKLYRGETVHEMASRMEVEIAKDACSLRTPEEALEYLRKLAVIVQDQIEFHGGKTQWTNNSQQPKN